MQAMTGQMSGVMTAKNQARPSQLQKRNIKTFNQTVAPLLYFEMFYKLLCEVCQKL